ncbi:MAG: UDP-N-acetylmuramoyl-L-alanine--D-glutamate ligase [Syntrophales bacterium]|jgi:UDP-N-acetylmuramoylalanine--D-glutamate ligase|nr:UDP-N-acetylmuramoyl-L-alanine--D-glutamate ligase [Syntrophales bacterium]MDY0043057.1 UDP-N-acetylmuramoyl-L-alanine--D-glutamate ligase [Syntrophales bacterium]
MNLKGKKILVIGLGKTGCAVSQFLSGQEARVVAHDDKESPDILNAMADLNNYGITCVMDSGSLDLSETDLIVPSPGVPPQHPLLLAALHRGIKIMSELELAFRFINKPIIAITGTNGKTTTTRLIGAILSAWGKKVFVGGNIGTPLIHCAGKDDEFDYLVAEVSSFQLQWIETFHPRIALLLNMTPDHADYHGSFDAYRSAKERIFENQTPDEYAVLNVCTEGTEALAGRIRSQVHFFSSSCSLENGGYVENEALHFSLFPEREVYHLDNIRLKGRHNMENIMAAVIAVRLCGCPGTSVSETLASFSGLEHRCEYIGEKGGIEFYNDSKGTNVGAVVRALESLNDSVLLLMGGRNKRGDFTPLTELVKRKVRKLILFGEARYEIGDSLGSLVKTSYTVSAADAVVEAIRDSQKGDTVLFSPGCASFDEFANYEERGMCFKNVVRRYTGLNERDKGTM